MATKRDNKFIFDRMKSAVDELTEAHKIITAVCNLLEPIIQDMKENPFADEPDPHKEERAVLTAARGALIAANQVHLGGARTDLSMAEDRIKRLVKEATSDDEI